MAQIGNAIKVRGFPRFLRDPVKLTALLYLREALLSERYEDCAGYITVAKEFGAQVFEIRNLLEDARRVPRG
ncbi:MAG: hypothetical protein Q8R76_09730 [Candidatus Omnitrophota bacterium]|nr:hypothetical protein [Candidatus Omnitrophota bacterium]